MKNAARKKESLKHASEAVSEPPELKVAGEQTAIPSPALALQSRLKAHYYPLSHHFMTRFVTLLVMFAALGTWFAQTGQHTVV